MKKRSLLASVFLSLCLFLSPLICWGQVGSDIALQGQAGNWVQFIPNAQVTICTSAGVPSGNTCTPLATVYTDQTLVTPAVQPIVADASGNYTVFAPGAVYYVCVVNPNVTPNTHFCKLTQIGSVGNFAPINSPAFTGNPTGPTPAPGDNSTSLATTAFVQLATAGTGQLNFLSIVTSPSTLNVSTEGTRDWLILSPLNGTANINALNAFRHKLRGDGSLIIGEQAVNSSTAGESTNNSTMSVSSTAGDEKCAPNDNFTTTGASPTTSSAVWRSLFGNTTNFGYTISTVADTNVRQINIYIGSIVNAGANQVVTIIAHLLDGSAGDITTTISTPSGSAWKKIPIQYKSKAGSRLEVSILMTTPSGANAELAFQALTIQ